MTCHAQEAIISGFFKQPAPGAAPVIEELPDEHLPKDAVPRELRVAARMDAILSTALEVANGMSYLHARSIVHGDLTGSNILLQECQVGAPSCSLRLACSIMQGRRLQHHARAPYKGAGVALL